MFSAWETKTYAYANSVDPDKTAHSDLQCLLFVSRLIFTDIPIRNTGRDQTQKQTIPLQKFRNERAN